VASSSSGGGAYWLASPCVITVGGTPDHWPLGAWAAAQFSTPEVRKQWGRGY